MNATTASIKNKSRLYSLTTPKERLALWEKIRGLWQNKRPDPVQELKKMRQEWERRPS